MVTYDIATRTVFSSDAFGGFSDDDALYAGETYPGQMSVFLGEYLGSRRALEYAIKRLMQVSETSGLDLICPQHGCLIGKEQIPTYLEAALNLDVGGQIDGLARKHGITLRHVD
jgi:flavorubredoxin